MPVAKVHRISANAPDDVSGIADAIERGDIDPRGVIAVFGKTEGNGCVNDFSRGFATMSLTHFFSRYMPEAEARKVCFVMSGGNIRNAVVRGAFLAAADGTAITMKHLMRAARF